MNQQKLTPRGAAGVQFGYQVSVLAGQSSTPTLTLAGGAPAALVDWGDGTVQMAVVSGTALNHVYAVGGTYTVRLIMPKQDVWVTKVEFVWCKVTGDLLMLAIPRLKALTLLSGYDNPLMTGGFNLASLPVGVTFVYLYNTGCVMTGTLANLPGGMTYLNLHTTPSAITGTLSSLPVGVTLLALTGSPSTITGGASAMLAKSIVNLYLDSMIMTQAQVDDCINRIYADRMLFTAPSPGLQIGGTNPAPSGVYQLMNPPVTGKEKIYWLVVNPLAEVRPNWAINYTA